MKSTFFTADTHFNHGEIREWCKRPFATLEEMNEQLIENWNRVVKPGDTVYHLGDFAVNTKKLYRFKNRLNGNIFLIRGNHDTKEVKLAGFGFVKDFHVLRIDKQTLVMCHFPMRTWYASKNGSIMLHGHAHGFIPPWRRSFDVGVDCWRYRPIHFDEVMEKTRQLDSMSWEEQELVVFQDTAAQKDGFRD